jgi:hypothetical protein
VQKRLGDAELCGIEIILGEGKQTVSYKNGVRRLVAEVNRARESEARLTRVLARLYEAAVLLDSGGYDATVGPAINAAKAALAGVEEP